MGFGGGMLLVMVFRSFEWVLRGKKDLLAVELERYEEISLACGSDFLPKIFLLLLEAVSLWFVFR